MLDRVAALEPRVQHAMGEDAVGLTRLPRGAPDREAAVLPEPVDQRRVVIVAMVTSHFTTPGAYP